MIRKEKNVKENYERADREFFFSMDIVQENKQLCDLHGKKRKRKKRKWKKQRTTTLIFFLVTTSPL